MTGVMHSKIGRRGVGFEPLKGWERKDVEVVVDGVGVDASVDPSNNSVNVFEKVRLVRPWLNAHERCVMEKHDEAVSLG